ncbi:hypothetical protein Hdeb2414_s0022g00616681 [Helianthus debilis subsp. tardiflorus]
MIISIRKIKTQCLVGVWVANRGQGKEKTLLLQLNSRIQQLVMVLNTKLNA